MRPCFQAYSHRAADSWRFAADVFDDMHIEKKNYEKKVTWMKSQFEYHYYFCAMLCMCAVSFY